MPQTQQGHVYQLGQTGRLVLEDMAYDVEMEVTSHHQGRSYANCEADCPEGWQIPQHQWLQAARNSPARDQFNLLNTHEFVQNPDDISRANGYVARFYAYSDWANLNCVRLPSGTNASLGVRYARKIPKIQPDPDKPIDAEGKGDYQVPTSR